MLTETAGVLGWAVVPDPDGDPVATRDQVANTKRFNGGEGAAISKGRLVFTTKGDGRVWRYDPSANTLTIIYDDGVTVNGVLTGVDNVETSKAGTVYVAEDAGDMQIVLVRSDGRNYPGRATRRCHGIRDRGAGLRPDGRTPLLQLTAESGSDVRGPRPVGDLRRRDRLSNEVGRTSPRPNCLRPN